MYSVPVCTPVCVIEGGGGASSTPAFEESTARLFQSLIGEKLKTQVEHDVTALFNLKTPLGCWCYSETEPAPHRPPPLCVGAEHLREHPPRRSEHLRDLPAGRVSHAGGSLPLPRRSRLPPLLLVRPGLR